MRDEESETQRKAHAKRVRETRRSTQGVTLDEIKSAEELVKKKNLGMANNNNNNNINTTTSNTISNSGVSSPVSKYRIIIHDHNKNPKQTSHTRGSSLSLSLHRIIH